jgi:hypothetical protein
LEFPRHLDHRYPNSKAQQSHLNLLRLLLHRLHLLEQIHLIQYHLGFRVPILYLLPR